MKPVDKYKSAAHFRMAVKHKLSEISQRIEQDIQRLYRQAAYTQLLARLFLDEDISWVLKGGHALELRLKKSRATKDVDLAMRDIKLKKNLLIESILSQFKNPIPCEEKTQHKFNIMMVF